MKKSAILKILLTFLILVLIVDTQNLFSVKTGDALSSSDFSATELLCRPTNTSITINIVPSINGQIYIEYGQISGTYPNSTEIITLTSGAPNNIKIQGLTPNTRYYYRTVTSTDGINWETGVEHAFQTQRSIESTFTFTVTSDSHVNIQLGLASIWQQTMTNIANDRPDFQIDCGDTFAMDNVFTVLGAEQAYLYQRQFFNIPGSSAPIFLAVGNHEEQEAWHIDDTGNPATSQPVMGVNAQKKYFPNPIPDDFYSGNTNPYSHISGDHLLEDYYAWTWGDALFVIIDPYWYTTTKPFFGNMGGGESSDVGSGNRWDWTLGLQQFKWLNQTLQDSNAKYKFIFAHHMTGGADNYGGRGGAAPANLFEWGGYNVDGTSWGWDTNRPIDQWGIKPIEQILNENRVTVFFHGHDHQYAYEKRDGIVFQSLPSAGFIGNGFNSYNQSPYAIKVLSSPGHLRVTVTPEQVTVDYITSAPNQSTNGQITYSYTISDVNNTPTPSPSSTLTPPITQSPSPTIQPTHNTTPNPTSKPSTNPQTSPTNQTSNSSPSPTPQIPEYSMATIIAVFSLATLLALNIRKKLTNKNQQ